MLMFCTSSTKSIIAAFREKSSAFLSFFQIFQIVRSYPIFRVFSTCFPVKTPQCDPILKVFRITENFNKFSFPCLLHPRTDSGIAPVRDVRTGRTYTKTADRFHDLPYIKPCRAGFLFPDDYASLAFASSARAVNPAGSLTAISARTFLFRTISACFKPNMNLL